MAFQKNRHIIYQNAFAVQTGAGVLTVMYVVPVGRWQTKTGNLLVVKLTEEFEPRSRLLCRIHPFCHN